MDALRDRIPDYARDLRLNLSSVLTPQGAPGLSEPQLWMTALASAIASRNAELARAVEAAATEKLEPVQVEAARAAAAIMGMNNVYYRFLHLVEDDEYAKLPARLRMNVIGSPGVDKARLRADVARRVGGQRLRQVRLLARAHPARSTSWAARPCSRRFASPP